MKKLVTYILIGIFIIVILPSLCTKKRKEKVAEKNEVKEEANEVQKYDYSKYSTIRLYHSKTSEVEELPIDEYLYGVVSSEMPASYEKEALKAQAIVARTYTIYQISHSMRKTPKWRYL